jgi:formate--tetrahydrofolate ligase
MRSDIEIADSTPLRPIAAIAAAAGIPADALEPYGRFKAKIGFDFIAAQQGRPDGALVLVTGISPTPAGEGKTTTTIGLGDALRRIGQEAMICLREPSLGPCFGVKGGATGGGMAQVAPMAEINLHFTGDFHAITAANNLLAAMLDNHIYWGNALGIDPRKVTWRRAMDMNDRALRTIVTSLAGNTPGGNGALREDHFDITVASEVMAVFCLARDLADLQARLGRIIVATSRDGVAITARDLKADGAMAALLRDALMPNLVQSLEGTPALVHGGPFANIAHGCNSVMATKLALKLAPVVVTEAGFGADLGGEKFLDIKCRSAGLTPSACVVVATIRALKMHGGVAKTDLGRENLAALSRGMANLARHVENMGRFGLPVVVALNRFMSDTEAEFAAVQAAMAALGVEAILCDHWAQGAAGAEALAHAVMRRIGEGSARFAPIYPNAMTLADKLRTVAQTIYRARDVEISPAIAKRLAGFEAAGFGDLPVCIAKTQYSFTADPAQMGAPEGHTLPVREVRLSAGAGFVVAVCGDVMTMPGLPRRPSSEGIGLDAEGRIAGLF